MPRRGGRAAKKPATTPDGISPDEQRAWLRRRILDNFQRAGRPDEAIAYYKQAVKSDPENLNLRLELASALLANEQTIAARNEVQRILDKDPKHIDALLLQAGIHQSRDEDEASEQSLRHILEIDPAHDTARRGIGRLLLERGVEAFNAGQYYQARKSYTDALQFSPNDVQVRVFLGETELALGKTKAGLAHFETALATGDIVAYGLVFTHWVHTQNESEARKILERAQSAGLATPRFYTNIGVTCLTRAPSPPPDFGFGRRPDKPCPTTKWETWGRELIQQGLDSAPDRVEALHHLLAALGPAHPAITVVYARELITLQPDEVEHYLALALFLGMTGDIQGGKSTLTQAERIARKQGQTDLLRKIAEIRSEISSPMFAMLGPLIAMGGPNVFDMDDEDFF